VAGYWKKIPGGVTSPAGFLAAGISCGIKESGRKDLALLYSAAPAAWGSVLTTSRAPAAPVQLTRVRLRRRLPLQAVLINSGNANAATGSEGLRNARELAAHTARLLALPSGAAIMASTGVIGEQLPAARIRQALPELVAGLARGGGSSAAEGIMTTDSRKKEEAVQLVLPGKATVRIGGMAKGAGMIHPHMATMLAFLSTDAALSEGRLRGCLREAVEGTFNRISVDGDRSTNDTVLIMANGASGREIKGGRDESVFQEGLQEACRRLAEKIVLDGEGATKLVEVTVVGAKSRSDAEKAARAVANSPLVKTSWFGEDLNWGRIIAALGYSGARLAQNRTSIAVNGVAAVRNGVAAAPAAVTRARREMRKKRIALTIDLGCGGGAERVLACDLSLEYVKENSEYTT
jgi:glutamate N-acetyltransferase/amino-acid N-acetyltransferase